MPRKEDLRLIDRIVKEEGLSREQRRLLHDEISGQRLTVDEIREVAKEIKQLYLNK